MLENTTDVVHSHFAHTSITIRIVKQILAVFPETLVTMHTTAIVTKHRLGHKGQCLTVCHCCVLQDVFVELERISHSNQRAILEIDFHLAGRGNLAVMDLHIDPDGAKLVLPADIPVATAAEIRRLAIAAFQAVECSGMARVDFFLERGSGRVVLNEINTIPGFTNISMYPKMCEASGLAYPELLDRLIELALERHRRRRSLRYSL